MLCFLLRNEKGFIAVLATVLLLGAVLAMVLSLTALSLGEYRVSSNLVKSGQAYFSAEAGIEDAIWRIRNNKNLPANYNFNLAGATVQVAVSDAIGGARTILSQGQDDNVFKKLRAVHSISGDQVQFFFGAQVGDGGMTMAPGSQVQGNIFSNSTVSGSGSITGSAVIAKNGSKLDGITVDEDAQVHTCVDSVIGGDLYYVSGGSAGNCLAGGLIKTLPNEIAPLPLPIPESQLAQWRSDAEAGGTTFGGYTVSGNESLGPRKIDGNLIVDNNAVLTLQGILWVTGNVNVNNNAVVRLDPAVFGSASGVLLAGLANGTGGFVDLVNNCQIQGSGQPGSYLMLLTTSLADPAMYVRNNTTSGIFYASQGFIEVRNNANVKEITAYGLHLNNNVVVQYEVGLSNLFFSTGPGGGWQVETWQEVE